MKRLLNEPVLLGAVIRTGILAAMAFGAHVTLAQLAALMVFVETLLALLTRAFVTPNHLAEYRVAQGGSPTTPINP